MRILIADDNSEVRSALRLVLEQEPVLNEVVEVADTQSLITNLREECPTVVLLDWELPGLRGTDRLMMLRSHCPGIKVIALSSKFEARQEALAAGVDGFVSKAEPPEQILITLSSLVPQLKKEVY